MTTTTRNGHGKVEPIDWEKLEGEYRTGLFSNRQLAEKYGCWENAIRVRAKKYKWTKDLTGAVKLATNEKLLRAELRTPLRTAEGPSDKALVENASNIRVDIQLTHREFLDRQTRYLAQLEEKFAAAIAKVDNLDGIGRALALVESMARTMAKLIPLQRQAFNLDDKSTPPADDAKLKALQAEFLALWRERGQPIIDQAPPRPKVIDNKGWDA